MNEAELAKWKADMTNRMRRAEDQQSISDRKHAELRLVVNNLRVKVDGHTESLARIEANTETIVDATRGVKALGTVAGWFAPILLVCGTIVAAIKHLAK